MKVSKKQIILFVCAILFLLFLIYMIWTNISLETTHYTVVSDRLPESFSGFRIVQISDLHNAEFGKDNHRLLKKLKEIKPDIIVLTGDLVDSRHTNCEIAVSFARQAVTVAPTYYITGNHEERLDNLKQFYEDLEVAGVTLLLDESVFIQKGDDQIQLAGILDLSFRKDATETENAIHTLIPESETYSILLSHNPELFYLYKNSHADLVLSGHVHGGQFRLPFVGGLYAPGQGLFPEYDSGTYTENGTTMIISRGLGNSIFPFRFNNCPEIVVIELKKGS